MEKYPVLVSICCTTYNHAKFLRDAINGFLMQKTNFPIEIIIHDDASTDGTADIIREYEKKYPDLIRPIYQKENQYSQGKKPMTDFVFPQARGKYIATCEGDDYWIDPYKLQKQADFLEANQDYVLCFTDCMSVNEFGIVLQKSVLNKQRDHTYTSFDMPHDLLAPLLTRVFRNQNLNQLPRSFYFAAGGDAYLLYWHSKSGRIKYLNYCSSVYRVTKQGAWCGKRPFAQKCDFFKNRLAILDIVERDLWEKRVYLLIWTLINILKSADKVDDFLLCKEYYVGLQNLLIKEWRGRICVVVYIKIKLCLVSFYYCFYLLVRIGRMIGIKKGLGKHII